MCKLVVVVNVSYVKNATQIGYTDQGGNRRLPFFTRHIPAKCTAVRPDIQRLVVVVVVVVDAILPKRSCQHARAIRRGEGAPEEVQSGDPSPAGG